MKVPANKGSSLSEASVATVRKSKSNDKGVGWRERSITCGSMSKV